MPAFTRTAGASREIDEAIRLWRWRAREGCRRHSDLRKVKNFIGFVDDQEQKSGTEVIGYPVLGDGHWLQKEAARYPVAIALGIGNNLCRFQVRGTLRCLECGSDNGGAPHSCGGFLG